MKMFEFAAVLRRSGASPVRAPVRALRRRRSHPATGTGWVEEETFSDPAGWQTVTVGCSPDEASPGGRLPDPLAALAELLEVRLTPAPGGRGTELSARTRQQPRPDATGWKGEDPARQIRTALRYAKELIEVGEVLLVEPQPAGRRRRPAAGLLVDLMSDGADQKGVL